MATANTISQVEKSLKLCPSDKKMSSWDKSVVFFNQTTPAMGQHQTTNSVSYDALVYVNCEV